MDGGPLTAQQREGGAHMLSQEGHISFVDELLELIDGFVGEYERTAGPLRNELERGLAVIYLLGVMQCDIKAIGECVGGSAVFGQLHPRVVFQECMGSDAEAVARRQAAIAQAIRARGWVKEG